MNDRTTTQPAAGAAPGSAASSLARIAFLLEERPLLWCEDPEEDDALRAATFEDMNPESAIEHIMVKNLVDVLWETRRMRKMSNVSINTAASWAALAMFEPRGSLGDAEWKQRLGKVARAGVFGQNEKLKPGEANLEEHCDVRHITPEMLNYEGYKREAASIDAIRRECERLETRARRLLQDFETRKSSLAAMARTLLAREAGQDANTAREN